jgi:lysophospholipase L1-like esterase
LLAKHGTLTPLSVNVQIRTLERYWSAIKEIVPDPFVTYNKETGDDPNKYCIQQPIGVVSLHILLQDLAAQMQTPPEQLAKEDFVNLLNVPCIKKTENWERPDGDWTQYGTNMKGYTRIAEDILNAIKKHNSKTWNELMRK